MLCRRLGFFDEPDVDSGEGYLEGDELCMEVGKIDDFKLGTIFEIDVGMFDGTDEGASIGILLGADVGANVKVFLREIV